MSRLVYTTKVLPHAKRVIEVGRRRAFEDRINSLTFVDMQRSFLNDVSPIWVIFDPPTSLPNPTCHATYLSSQAVTNLPPRSH
jgi:hypothetical protein